MHSFAQMNGQHQQVGTPLQAFQAGAPLAQDATRNHLWTSANNTINSGIQPSERHNITSYNKANSNGHLENWQTSAVSNQAVNSQNAKAVKHISQIVQYLQSTENSQNGNTSQSAMNGFPSSQLQIFHQNSANQRQQNPINTNATFLQQNTAQLQTFHQPTNQSPLNTVITNSTYAQQNASQLQIILQNNTNQRLQNTINTSASFHQQNTTQLQTFHQNSANQSPQNTINPNTAYPNQDKSSFWKLLLAGQAISTSQPNGVQHCLYQNANGSITKVVSAYTTAASSSPHTQVVNSSILVPGGVHNPQAAHNQIPKQSHIERRFSPSYPSSHCMVTSKSSGVNSMTAQPSNTQTLYASNMSQKTQHAAQTGFPCKNWTNANSSKTHSMSQSIARYVGATIGLSTHPNVAPQQMPRPKETTNSQCMLSTAGSDSRHPPPPPYSVHSGVVRQSNWNMQTVSSVSSPGSFNMNVSRSLPLHSGQSTPQSIVSRSQYTVNTQPLQKSLPHVSSVTTEETGDTRGETDQACLPYKDLPSRGIPVVSLNKTRPLINAPTRVSTQNMSYLAKHPELLNILGYSTQVQQSDGSALSTPSHTGARVVAVVQPLSQENAVTSLNSTTWDSVTDPEKDCISPEVAKQRVAEFMAEQSCLRKENPNKTSSNKEISSDGTVLKSSDLEHHNLTVTSEVDTEAAAAAERSSEVTASQSSPKERNKRATPPSPSVPDLSSLPTTPWTAKALSELILTIEKSQKKLENVSKHDEPQMLIKAKYKEWFNCYKPGIMQDFISNVEKICELVIKEDTVVLSQVKRHKLKHYHVLSDEEVYSEPPYKSLWLNLNDQLDDIDKDFGFPWFFRYHQYVHNTDGQMDQVKMADSVPEQVANEVPKAVLTESQSTDLVEEKQPPDIETPSTPASPNQSESNDLTNSPYSFKIHVLAPEEAKVFYEQVQKSANQVINYQELTAAVNNSEQNVTPKKMGAAPIESVDLIRPKSDKIDQICCLAKLMEMLSGLSRPSFKCQCQEDESHPENTAKTLTLDPDSPGNTQEDSCQIISLSSTDIFKEFSQIIDLTVNDDKLLSSSYREPMTFSDESYCIQSDVGESDKDDDLSNRDPDLSSETTNVANAMIDPVDECAQEEFKSTETMQLRAIVIGAKQTQVAESPSTENEVCFRMSDQEEKDCEVQLLPTVVAESSLQSKEDGEATNQTSSGQHLECKTLLTTQKRQSSLDQYFTLLNEPKKCKVSADLDLQNVSDVQASEEKTVELVLFGSAKHEGSASGTSDISCPSYENLEPPTVLSVNLNPSRENSVEASSAPKYSVKQAIYEKWRKSFPPMTLSVIRGHRKKWNIQRSFSAPLPTVSLKRRKWSGLSEINVSDGNGKCRRKRRRRSTSCLLSPKEVKKRRYSVALGQESRNTENESQDAMPLQENIVLKFSVLPNTFSFMDGSTRRNETADSTSDKPDLAEEKDWTPNNAVGPTVRHWRPTPQKQYWPLRVSRNVDLFNEYQKKYNKRRHSPPEKRL